MFVRRSKTKKKGKTYYNYLLMDSYRNEDGDPRNRVILTRGSDFDLPRDKWRNFAKAVENRLYGTPALFDDTDDARRWSGGSYLQKWFRWATHSRIKQMGDFAWSMRRHQDGILSWFKTPMSNAVVEGMNGKAKAVMRRAYGCRTFSMLRLTLLHNLGKLPETQFSSHKFL